MFAKTPSGRSRFTSSHPAVAGKSTPQTRASMNRSSQSVFSSRKKLSKNQSLNRSVLDETTGTCIENLGGSLPVLVTEALTLADKSSHTSLSVDGNEWAWLVCGRRLFVWRFRQRTGQGKMVMKATQCKELTLPASDLAHTAELVTVISNADQQITASICVSPEGVIRYWPSISHEGSFVEISADLRGEECAAMIYRPTFGCIVATTTSTLLQINITRGQNPILCRQLAAPQSTLARVSRRMSSFIFGSVTAQSTGAAFHQLLPALDDQMDVYAASSFYVLSGCYLQKWHIQHETEKLIYQFEIEKKMKEAVASELWRKDPAHLPELQFWLLDIQSIRGAVCVLGAAVNREVSQDLYYVLATVQSGETPPEELISCSYVNYVSTYSEDEEAVLLGYKLLIADHNGTVAFLYNDSQCLRVQLTDLRMPAEKIEFLSSGGKIIGAGSTDSQALFFAVRHGFVVIRTNPVDQSFSILEESGVEPAIPETSAVTNISRRVDEDDKISRLKTAILLNVRGKKCEMMGIVNELFPPSLPPEHNSPLDVSISQLSLDLIDDFPAADPRWAESSADSSATTGSLIILHQLQDKLKAHQHFISFLHDACLWPRLSSTTVRASPTSTRRLLCQHAEKIVATIALRNLHSDHTRLVDSAIKQTLELRGSQKPENGLTAQDLFYRLISRIDEVFKVLIEQEVSILASDLSSDEAVSLITKVNDIVVSMLHDAINYRQENQDRYSDDMDVEYLPWTASIGADGLRTLICTQFNVTVDNLKSRTSQNRHAYLQQVTELADIQLDGYRQQILSLDPNSHAHTELLKRFESERSSMIQPLIDDNELERAAALAEKYLDFRVLASLCEQLHDQERLERYMHQYQDQGFTDFLLRWYMEEGKRGKVLALPVQQSQVLDEFFDSEENKFMRWLHEIDQKNFTSAHLTLHELASSEHDSLSKKKTLLSLSKLCALASEDRNELAHHVEKIDVEHDVIAHQESLPESVCDNLALDPDNMSVFSVRDLVQLYTGPCNQSASEFDYKKALDLLALLEPGPDTDKLRMQVWCSAIKRDRWDTLEGLDPVDANRDTIFFRTAELAYAEGLNLLEFLPEVNSLLACEELGDLRQDKHFRFLVKAGYEHVTSIVS